jgi:hypothetical protein
MLDTFMDPLSLGSINTGFFQRQSFDSTRLQGPILETDYSEMASFRRCESGQSSASSLFDSIGTLTCVVTAFLRLYLAGASCRELRLLSHLGLAKLSRATRRSVNPTIKALATP